VVPVLHAHDHLRARPRVLHRWLLHKSLTNVWMDLGA
jgi:hypothetical protein